MSFRIEEKILLKRSDLNKLKKFIYENGGKTIFPKRKVRSIYFDNKNFQSFHDSEEGCVPRKKIRIRNYDNHKKYSLEIKINSNEGKFKKSFIINQPNYLNKIKKGFFDTSYGTCYPLIEISYNREYFKLDDFRLTLDDDILYKSFTGNNFFLDSESLVLEIKTNNLNIIDKHFKMIPMQRSRFSKYCKGIEGVFGKPFFQRYMQN